MKSRIKSFAVAFEGIKFMFLREPNFRIHLLATIVVVTLGFVWNISIYEWLAIIFVTGIVIITEAINTAIEKICDKIQPQKDQDIKVIKDIGAAAVLISAIMAVVVGIIIFTPKIITQ